MRKSATLLIEALLPEAFLALPEATVERPKRRKPHLQETHLEARHAPYTIMPRMTETCGVPWDD